MWRAGTQGMLRTFSRRDSKYPALWRSVWHRVGGAAALITGGVALYFGFMTNWMLKQGASAVVSLAGPTVWVALTGLAVLPFVLDNA